MGRCQNPTLTLQGLGTAVGGQLWGVIVPSPAGWLHDRGVGASAQPLPHPLPCCGPPTRGGLWGRRQRCLGLSALPGLWGGSGG